MVCIKEFSVLDPISNTDAGRVEKQHSKLVPQIYLAAPEVERLGHRPAAQKFLVDCVVDELPVAFGSHHSGMKKDSQMMGDVRHLDFQK